MNSGAIGIFDSGVGGLTVFKALKAVLPSESLIYLGDTARVPYGTKSAETVIKYSLECAHFLVQRNIKALVVACNTSSAYSIPFLSKEIKPNVIGVIRPGVKMALEKSASQHIGVIGTPATVASNAYAKMLKELSPKARVISQACPLFVPLVEEGWIDNEVAFETAKIYLESFKNEKIDTLILGCTHYPLLKPVIARVMGEGVTLIDSAYAVAAAVKEELQTANMLASPSGKGAYQIYVTDLPARFEGIAHRFLGGDVPSVKRVEL